MAKETIAGLSIGSATMATQLFFWSTSLPDYAKESPSQTDSMEVVEGDSGFLSQTSEFGYSLSADDPNSLSSSYPEEDGSSEDIYFFESDHLALKGNSDYQALLKSIALLEAQRTQAIKDLDTLHQCRKDALEDPIAFVDKLQHGVDLGIPKAQKIAEVPEIPWEKYTSCMDFSTLIVPKHMTRLKRQLTGGTDKSDTEDPKPGPSRSFGEVKMENPITLVRGRVKDESKPSTFNKLWTAEEQKRLEDLLLQYPPEEVESKRWQKIATALGNRTPIQVASRVQKYFIKLAKAGLPIPGRMPNLNMHKNKAAHKHHRFHKFYHQPSTFMQSHEPPVYMSEEDPYGSSIYGYNDDSHGSYFENSPEVSDEEDVPYDFRSSPEYQELMHLKRIKQDRLQTSSSNMVEHQGFKCDQCNCEPIVGTRWHCTDCPEYESVDFCDDCVDSNPEIGQHNSSHRLKPFKKAVSSAVMDSDYMPSTFMPGDYNYLDPNYMPAS
ncbi:hypothetical protein FSP39_014998 [Pinctada imbricata]|uniref:ZZ-type zinc finger-containing protein 3 n=1 Tax=Pinctada imbricata TaxID=66713 RepID=A0AA89BMD3_PINIB|nr:hypothetical protein FSP39_014998 [Pinctada imbricata]